LATSSIAEAVRRDYSRLAADYARRWRAFNTVVREWVLARWPDGLAAGARVLDLGCGPGAFLAAVAERDPALALVGLDLTPALLKQARRRAPSAMLVEADAEALPFRDGAFDVVCSLNVLHHLRDPERHAAVLAGLCRPGGTVFLCTFDGGRGLAVRVADGWLKRRSAGWQGMLSAGALDRVLAAEPRLDLRERDALAAGLWRLQVLRLKARSPAPVASVRALAPGPDAYDGSRTGR